MTKKAKIIVAAVAAFLVLVIAGLAVGLVLVAQQVQMTNSVSVTYTANNVECDIEIFAVHYLTESFETSPSVSSFLNSTTAEIVQILGEDENGNETRSNSISKHIYAYENDGASNPTNLTNTYTFEDVQLQPIKGSDGSTKSSVVVYYFRLGGLKSNVRATVSFQGLLDNLTEEINDASGKVVGVFDLPTYYFALRVDDISESANFNGNILFTIEYTDESSGSHVGGTN